MNGMPEFDRVVLDGELSLDVVLDGEIGIITSVKGYEYPVYDGDYVVTPHAWEQYLDTDHKTMLNDVTVLEIPYTEVGNMSGGLTVSIG